MAADRYPIPILALDSARQFGWAFNPAADPSNLKYGSTCLAPAPAGMGLVIDGLIRLLSALIDECEPQLVFLEELGAPKTWKNDDAVWSAGGRDAIVKWACVKRQLPQPRYLKVNHIRKCFVGFNPTYKKHGDPKPYVVQACRRIGWNPVDHNAADAIALHTVALADLRQPQIRPTEPLFARKS